MQSFLRLLRTRLARLAGARCTQPARVADPSLPTPKPATQTTTILSYDSFR